MVVFVFYIFYSFKLFSFIPKEGKNKGRDETAALTQAMTGLHDI